jgi:hypothetical protein
MTPKCNTRNCIMSEPPPTPAIPARSPTPKATIDTSIPNNVAADLPRGYHFAGHDSKTHGINPMAMKCGLANCGLPYLISSPSSPVTRPPAAASTA